MDFGVLTPSLASGSTSWTTNGKCDDEAKLDDADGDDGDGGDDGDDNDSDENDDVCTFPLPRYYDPTLTFSCTKSMLAQNRTMLPLV